MTATEAAASGGIPTGEVVDFILRRWAAFFTTATMKNNPKKSKDKVTPSECYHTKERVLTLLHKVKLHSGWLPHKGYRGLTVANDYQACLTGELPWLLITVPR